ncbi:MAG TPA: hypothetical protein ENK43_12690 [Planctomycetes bacterium]|nr:hypothetical protein [Planctomycetota bacterium]
MWIGVLADTSGGIHPGVLDLFDGMDFIVHCGRIGSPDVLNELSNISPISGVLGMGDAPEDFPFEAVFAKEMGGVLVMAVHDVGNPNEPRPVIQELVEDREPKVVLFGRPAEAFSATLDDRLWFGPGSASASHPSPSVGIVEIDGASLRSEIILLKDL